MKLFLSKIEVPILCRIQLSLHPIFKTLPHIGFILECRKIIRKKWSADHTWPNFLTRGLRFSLHKEEPWTNPAFLNLSQVNFGQLRREEGLLKRLPIPLTHPRQRYVAGTTPAGKRTGQIVLVPYTSLFQGNLVFYSEWQFSTCCLFQNMLQHLKRRLR